MKIFTRVNKFIVLIIFVCMSTILSGCTLLGYQKVEQYPEPTENTPRAKVMLVSDFGGGLFGIVDFYVEKRTEKTLYLHAEGKKTNVPTVKNLGVNMKIEGKYKANEVYLPADVNIPISSYGEASVWRGTIYCHAHKNIKLEQGKEYVLSFDKIEAGKTYCSLNLYEILIDNNNNKSIKTLN